MGGEPAPGIVLYRRDLRVADNGALAAAADSGKPVIALFILDKESASQRAAGAASRWWLHHSLTALTDKLAKLGAQLVLKRGKTDKVVADAIHASGADAVFWNRRYDPAEAAVDGALKSGLRKRGVRAESFDGALLHEPSRLKTGSGGFYKVYTPFRKALGDGPEPRDPIDAPKSLSGWNGDLKSERLDDFDLLPVHPDWSTGIAKQWTPGEDGAQRCLDEFLNGGLGGYDRNRDFPGEAGTSMLSPHLAHGEITPFQILAALRRSDSNGHHADADTFRREIAWREFCWHLLFHNPDLRRKNFHPGFDAFEWRRDARGLHAWRRGMTGYPIVDAGMRELWQTGWMQNRVRMITASFLIKHLLLDWRDGEEWFWDTLVDADAASNPANWQWVAGSGADAAPYFRIFNPILQGEKFDPHGAYVRRYVPELAGLPDRYLHRPWDAPDRVLEASGVTPGKSYPHPIVDHAQARERAMQAYRAMRQETR